MLNLKHVIDARQFDPAMMEEIFFSADLLAKGKGRYQRKTLREQRMAILFYQPSLRTRFSHSLAAKLLGACVVESENAREFSSAAKGESLEDTIQVLGRMFDLIVLRHYEAGAAKRAADLEIVPIINAGDGPGHHPTQALLDVWTIKKALGTINGLRIAMVGDLLNGRTVRSLCYLLGKYKDVEIVFVSPLQTAMKQDVKDYLTEKGVRFSETESLESLLPSKVDVIYQTRIQKEWFADQPEVYERILGCYIINRPFMDQLGQGVSIMHPLPRVGEITPDIDNDPRAIYFQQAENGLYIRMALMKILLHV